LIRALSARWQEVCTRLVSRGKQTKNIAKVAAARKLLTLIYYGLRDGQIRVAGRQVARGG
jgi:hypothetical protein